MKKNRLFIILIIVIVALTFTTAQICNQCSISPSQETKEDVVDETVKDDTSSETTARETTVEEEVEEETTESEVTEESEEEPESESMPEVSEEEVTVIGDENKSGYISKQSEETANIGMGGSNPVTVGDNVPDEVIKGYLTFSLSHFSGMENVIVTEVEIRIPEVDSQNEPWNAGSELHILVKDFGETLDYPEDFERGGEVIKVFATSDTLNNLNFSNEELKNELQDALSEGKELFQLKFSLNNKSNNGNPDWYGFPANSADLYVKYIPGS